MAPARSSTRKRITEAAPLLRQPRNGEYDGPLPVRQIPEGVAGADLSPAKPKRGTYDFGAKITRGPE